MLDGLNKQILAFTLGHLTGRVHFAFENESKGPTPTQGAQDWERFLLIPDFQAKNLY